MKLHGVLDAARLWESVPSKAARAAWTEFRASEGRGPAPYVGDPTTNPKLARGDTAIYGLHLLPHTLGGGPASVCPYSTPECRKGCLNTAGRGSFDKVQDGRWLRTQFLFDSPAAAVRLIHDEIARGQETYGEVAVRLNVLSDIPWEEVVPSLFDALPDVQFYDYTKWPNRVDLPDNYLLTYSVSEKTADEDLPVYMGRYGQLAVVFDGFPTTWHGWEVVDGDVNDERWLDPRPSVLALKAKGLMRKGTWAMVHVVEKEAA